MYPRPLFVKCIVLLSILTVIQVIIVISRQSSREPTRVERKPLVLPPQRQYIYLNQSEIVALKTKQITKPNPLSLLWSVPVKRPYLRRGYSVLGTDCHRGPRAEVGSLLPKLGITYIDRSIQLAGNIDFFKKPLHFFLAYHKFIPGIDHNRPAPWNTLLYENVQRDFFEEHKNDEDFKKADAFTCSFDPHYCFLFIPFNKPIIALFAYRLEGHYAPVPMSDIQGTLHA